MAPPSAPSLTSLLPPSHPTLQPFPPPSLTSLPLSPPHLPPTLVQLVIQDTNVVGRQQLHNSELKLIPRGNIFPTSNWLYSMLGSDQKIKTVNSQSLNYGFSILLGETSQRWHYKTLLRGTAKTHGCAVCMA